MTKKTGDKQALKTYKYQFIEGYKGSKEYKTRLSIKTQAASPSFYFREVRDHEGGYIPIYVTGYAYLFHFDKMKLIDIGTDKQVIVNPRTRLLPDYYKGFIDGQKHFKERFYASPEILYGKNSHKYERQLHMHFHHTDWGNLNGGWKYYMQGITSIISPDTLHKWGFFAGMIFELNHLINSNPIVFRKFYQCNIKEEAILKKSSHPKFETNDNDLSPGALIDPELSRKIIDCLIKYTQYHDSKEKTLSLLNDVFRGKSIERKIDLKLTVMQIGWLFGRIIKNGLLPAKGPDVEIWLMQSFKYYDTKTTRFEEIKQSTLHSCIFRKGRQLPKANRICDPKDLTLN